MAPLLALRKVSTETVDNSVGKVCECRVFAAFAVHWTFFSHFGTFLKPLANQSLTSGFESCSLCDLAFALIFRHFDKSYKAVDSVTR